MSSEKLHGCKVFVSEWVCGHLVVAVCVLILDGKNVLKWLDSIKFKQLNICYEFKHKLM